MHVPFATERSCDFVCVMRERETVPETMIEMDTTVIFIEDYENRRQVITVPKEVTYDFSSEDYQSRR